MTKKTNTKFRYLTKKEEEQTIIKILDTLLDPSLPYSGEHRRKQWEKGWAENLKSGDLKPKYFGKYRVNRLNGRFVWSNDKNYEIKMLYSLVDKYAKKYMSKAKVVIEFGAGTGHNLKRIKKINPKATLYGTDWADSAVKTIKKQGFESMKLDFFTPPYQDQLPKLGRAAYTVAALEQTGTDYGKFVNFLLKINPNIVVHIEPIPELLDPTNLLDYLSIKYMEKRKYLSGYLDYLRTLEKKGKIKILEARRSGIGSLFIDGYSVIVWKPL